MVEAFPDEDDTGGGGVGAAAAAAAADFFAATFALLAARAPVSPLPGELLGEVFFSPIAAAEAAGAAPAPFPAFFEAAAFFCN